jgi:AcrR family transcriptional regulator
MLGRSGWAGLSLWGLARQLGVSLATIQRHFATKDELWLAAVDAALPLRDLPSDADGADRPGITAAVWNDESPGAQSRIEHLTARSQAVIDGGRAPATRHRCRSHRGALHPYQRSPLYRAGASPAGRTSCSTPT